ncbi:hypothetical protein M0804_013887 [Polistes exclamans]|nr:hypothetical protein M0804_013887 [Polistes exclamans]
MSVSRTPLVDRSAQEVEQMDSGESDIDGKSKAGKEIQANEFRNVRLHTFWRNRPKLWFSQLEGEFAVYRIRSDEIKYSAVLRHLDGQVMLSVADIVEQPPQTGRYERLKTALIERYTDSVGKRLRSLLGGIELGDKTPSVLLREMRTLAGGDVREDMLRTLWTQRLPQRIQELLAISDECGLDKMAAIADRAMEVTATPSIASVDSSSREEVMQLWEEAGRLTATIAAMSKNRGKSRQAQPTCRSRAKADNITVDGWFFYHRRYKEKVFRCILPCKAPYPLAGQGNE